MNVDLRVKYRIQGNQPGMEVPEHPELGLEQLGAPKDGLYLREDVEIKCNITLIGFVKAEMKKASKEMVGRMIKKAELLDAGILKAMFDNGRLKTYNPADRSDAMAQDMMRQTAMPQGYAQSQNSPALANAQPQLSPGVQYSRPNTGSSQGDLMHNPYAMPQSPVPPPQNNLAPPIPPKTQGFAMELPGDTYYPQRSPSMKEQNSAYSPNYNRLSNYSTQSSDPRWSQGQASPGFQDPHRVSMGSVGNGGGYASPNMGHSGFAAELPAHHETREEYRR